MAWEQWNILTQRYSHNDLLFQYKLCAWICLEKLKDANNALRYLSVFKCMMLIHSDGGYILQG